MAVQKTNQCVYTKGHCLWRNTGPYCTALSLCVMSSIKWAAGEDWGILSLSLSVCVVLNFTKSKDFYCRTKHPQTRHTEPRGSALYSKRTMFVCVQSKTSVSSGLRCDLPVPISGVVVVFGAGLRVEELTGCIAGLPFAWGQGKHSPVMVVVMSGWFVRVKMEKTTSPESAIRPYRLHCWAQIKQHSKFSTKIKSVARVH